MPFLDPAQTRNEVAVGFTQQIGHWRFGAFARYDIELNRPVVVTASAGYEDECFLLEARFPQELRRGYLHQLAVSGQYDAAVPHRAEDDRRRRLPGDLISATAVAVAESQQCLRRRRPHSRARLWRRALDCWARLSVRARSRFALPTRREVSGRKGGRSGRLARQVGVSCRHAPRSPRTLPLRPPSSAAATATVRPSGPERPRRSHPAHGRRLRSPSCRRARSIVRSSQHGRSHGADVAGSSGMADRFPRDRKQYKNIVGDAAPSGWPLRARATMKALP
jgi:hypothetical protein